MSTIDEIRKRHREYDVRADGSLFADCQIHADRGTLLAMLDGEWTAERPTEGEWWVSITPRDRGVNLPAHYATFAAVVRHGVISCREGEYPADSFTGALWKRRTVPADPFAKGGGK